MFSARLVRAARADYGGGVQRTLAVVLTLLAIVIDQLTVPAIAPASRAIAAALRLDEASVARIGIGFDAAYLIALALSFWFIVVLGKRVYFGAAFIGFAAVSLLAAGATNGAMFAVARVLQGFTLGGLFTAALLTLMGACPPRALALAFAWFSILSLATPSFAPLFAGIVMQAGTWRAIFVAIAIPSLLGGLGGLLLFHDPYPARRVPIDAAAVAGLVAFVLGFETLVAEGAALLPALALVAGGTLYVVRQVRAPAPFFDLGLFRSALIGRSATIGILLGILLASATSLVAYLVGALGFAPSQAAALMALRFAGIIVGVPLITLLDGRRMIGSKAAMLVGLAIVAASFVAQHLVSVYHPDFAALAAIGIVQGFAFAFIVGPLASVVFAAVAHEELPSMAIIFKLSTALGVALAAPLVAAFLRAARAHYGDGPAALNASYADLWLAGAGVAIVAAAVVALLQIPAPRATTSPS
jgi:DHA2 family lincomycin resistance protein-like MFS transporter